MLTVAATEYLVDQNAPSNPFLLELDCSKNPTRDQIIAAVKKEGNRLLQIIKDDLGDDGDHGWDDYPKMITEDTYGDLCCEYDKDTYLFIGLPERLKHFFKYPVWYEITGIDRNGNRFKKITDNETHARSHNIWRGTLWKCTNDGRKSIHHWSN